MGIHMRSELEQFAAYRQGAKPIAVDGAVPHKLSSNENPYPPLSSVSAAVAAAAQEFNRYPDLSCARLVETLAKYWKVSENNLAFGAGSVEVAAQLIQAVTNPGDEVIYAWRSFEAYPLLVAVAGAVSVPVPLGPLGGHDLPAMADALTERTRLIFICNPNNPNGAILSATAVEEFLRRVPSNVLVVIDEAYLHFNTDPDTVVGIDIFRKYPNVAVLHTFSKAYGLAGLRLGYAIGPEELVTNLRKVAIPFAVSALAQEAGIASLLAEAELQERVNDLVSERERVYGGLAASGLPVLPSQANFVWLDTGADTPEVAAQFDEEGVSVRVFPDEGIRISIGTPEANDRVIAAGQRRFRRQATI
jgi:histidinol-phosphate aminotransferase